MGFTELLAAVSANAANALVVMPLFCCLRAKYPEAYSWRERVHKYLVGDADRSVRPAPTLKKTLTSWLPGFSRVSMARVRDVAGLDAYFFLRLLKMLVKISAVGLVVAGGALLPVHLSVAASGGDGMASFSIGNVTHGSDWLYMHVGVAYVLTFYVFHLTRHEWVHYVRHRHNWLQRGGVPQRSILVRNIPTPERYDLDGRGSGGGGGIGGGMDGGSGGARVGCAGGCCPRRAAGPCCSRRGRGMATQRQFEKLVTELYGDDVQSAHVVRDVADADTLFAVREKVVMRQERAQCELERSGTRPTHKPSALGVCGCLCCCATSVDTLDALAAEMSRVERVLEAKRFDCQERYTAGGFVTFSSVLAASSAAQVRHMPDHSTFRVTQATDPTDVDYSVFKVSDASLEGRRIVSMIATVVIVVLWAAPVAFIASLTTLESLAEYAPWLADIIALSPALEAALQGFLPSLAMLVFTAMLPSFFVWLMRFEAEPSKFGQQMGGARKMFLFYIVNVFFVTVLSGSVVPAAEQVLDRPASLLDILAESVPGSASFFMNFAVLHGLGVLPTVLLRIGSVLGGAAKMRVAVTPREEEAAVDPGTMEYHTALPVVGLFSVVALVFSVLAPVTLAITASFFALAFYTYKYHLVFVVRRDSESGGTVWEVAFPWLVVGLVMMHLTLIGALLLHGKAWAALAAAPLPLLAVRFHYRCDDDYRIGASILPRRLAVDASDPTDGQADTAWLDDVIQRLEAASGTGGGSGGGAADGTGRRDSTSRRERVQRANSARRSIAARRASTLKHSSSAKVIRASGAKIESLSPYLEKSMMPDPVREAIQAAANHAIVMVENAEARRAEARRRAAAAAADGGGGGADSGGNGGADEAKAGDGDGGAAVALEMVATEMRDSDGADGAANGADEANGVRVGRDSPNPDGGAAGASGGDGGSDGSSVVGSQASEIELDPSALDWSSVALEIAGAKPGVKFTEYQLSMVFSHEGARADVHRRFSALRALHTKLVKKFGKTHLPKFPPKKALGNKDLEFIAARAGELDTYVKCLSGDVKASEAFVAFVGPVLDVFVHGRVAHVDLGAGAGGGGGGAASRGGVDEV